MVKIGKLVDLNAIVKQDGKMKSDIFKAKGESLYAYAHIHIDTLALTHLHTYTHWHTFPHTRSAEVTGAEVRWQAALGWIFIFLKDCFF